MAPRDSLNAAYYGAGVTPSDILVQRTAKNPQAAPLVEVVKKTAALAPEWLGVERKNIAVPEKAPASGTAPRWAR